MIIPVYKSTISDPDQEYMVYALLDYQSDATFILDDVCDKLDASSKPTRLKLSTITSKSIIDCKRYTQLQIRGLNSTKHIPLPVSNYREFIPANQTYIPTSGVAERLPYKVDLARDLPPI